MWHRWKAGKKAALLAVVLALVLTGCGREQGEGEQLSGTVYMPKFTELKFPAEGISAGCADSRNLYLAANVNEAVSAGRSEAGDGTRPACRLYRIPLEGGEAAELKDYQPTPLPEGAEGSVSIQEVSMGADGSLWVTENIYSYTFQLPEGFNEETDDKWQYQSEVRETVIRRHLDGEGKELNRVDTGPVAERGCHIQHRLRPGGECLRRHGEEDIRLKPAAPGTLHGGGREHDRRPDPSGGRHHGHGLLHLQ